VDEQRARPSSSSQGITIELGYNGGQKSPRGLENSGYEMPAQHHIRLSHLAPTISVALAQGCSAQMTSTSMILCLATLNEKRAFQGCQRAICTCYLSPTHNTCCWCLSLTTTDPSGYEDWASGDNQMARAQMHHLLDTQRDHATWVT
jgi:hypothetical protein